MTYYVFPGNDPFNNLARSFNEMAANTFGTAAAHQRQHHDQRASGGRAVTSTHITTGRGPQFSSTSAHATGSGTQHASASAHASSHSNSQRKHKQNRTRGSTASASASASASSRTTRS